MKPFFSIIMACCDVEPYIGEALDSVQKQSFGDWECICGIEESKDRTAELIRERAAADPRIRFFEQPRSGSCSATRNRGTDLAQGEYVIFLDGDDTIEKESLAQIAARASLPRRVALPLLSLAAAGWQFPAKFYFRKLYYPLAERRR